MAPFLDNLSCDNEHWCSSLHINDLECTGFFANCNPGCVEPTNFAFIQRDGIPTGPPSPQEATFASFTPTAQTLLMNPGDTIRVHIFDARAPGGGHALEVAVRDLSSGQSGLMQASAANGFAATSLNDCSGTAFNYEPEYSSAAQSNVTPWGPDRTDISAEFEIGHFTPCSALSDPATDGLLGFTAGDPFWLTCNGPYESSADNGADNPEGFGGDAFCFPAGDTHTALNAFGISADPNEATGCLDILSTTARGGDVDYDGTSYWPDWPTGASPTATTPGSFLISAPTSDDHLYSQSIFQTDAALSEAACTPDSLANCTIPPPGPGNFYPYWSTVRQGDTCTIEFGDVASGPGVNNYGGAAQYGADRVATLGFPEFESKPVANIC
jgi:hypothetical protein